MKIMGPFIPPERVIKKYKDPHIAIHKRDVEVHKREMKIEKKYHLKRMQEETAKRVHEEKELVHEANVRRRLNLI